jgi:transcriptional regulator with XRE-family HTH domain
MTHELDDGAEFLRDFGRRLKVERVKRGLTQRQFADLIGVDRAFEGQVERGQSGMNIRALPRIAQALDTDLCLLLPPTPRPRPTTPPPLTP